MAAAVATLTPYAHPYGTDNTNRRAYIYGACSLSGGGTYVTNGIPLAWNGMTDATGQKFILPNVSPQQTQPQEAYFYSALGSGYGYVFDKTHNTLRIFNGGTELANAAAITADTINFSAEFIRQL